MTITYRLLLAAALTVPVGANAADATADPPADIGAEPEGYEYSGEIDVGWRAFIKRPPKSASPWVTPTSAGNDNRNNRSKFEEYGDIPPGPYAEYLRLSAQGKDGIYAGELQADNLGNNNQRYIFDASKTGEHYLTLIWDQIPHLYSTSAQSIWHGVGSNALTTSVQIPGSTVGADAAGKAMVTNALAGKFNTIDVGIRRDKGTVAYRWTPNQNVDVKASYSHEKREGIQTAGVVMGSFAAMQQVQMPRPIDDTTQIGKLNGQYFGPTPWGGHFNINIGGGVSVFDNSFNSFTVQNPFYDSSTAATRASYPQFARVSLAPSNEAYNAVVTSGIDLPRKARWNSTLQYTTMRQNDPFMPFTSNTNIYLPSGTAAFTTAGLPATSLNGEINNLLYNTSLMIPFSPEWRATTRYRIYDSDNQTPELLLPSYTVEDSSQTLAGGLYRAAGGPRRSLAYSYTKQNAGEELQWRPTKWATLGSSFGWERWDRTRRDVNVTNEFIGRGTADFRASDIITLRSSLQYSQRRYNKYDGQALAQYVWTDPAGTQVTNFRMRKFDMADRDQTKANLMVDLTPFENTILKGLVLSPTGGLRFEDYADDPNFFGLRKNNSWNVGLDTTYTFRPGNSISVSYMREEFDRDLVGSGTINNSVDNTTFPAVTNAFISHTGEAVNTVIVAGNVELIPGSLDLKLGYSISLSDEDWTFAPYRDFAMASCGAVPCSGFPTVKTNFQRLDATLKHTVDPSIVTKLGWAGEVYVKLRYIWERNKVENWQQELMSPYLYVSDTSISRLIEMGATNPNYDAQFVQLSLNAKW
ncbi:MULTISPECIES: MtrB/PioB family decaheme-associated outer membrane protein [Rhodopseudomonas]|uniref:Membrane protein n=1 Tax=Rhodopseudomonas palustris TaxID=1076 RepID=A0A0D7E9V3_RHOPL|nr:MULTISPECIES: MtrB/PioB family decaheme-associated outer membrane protein [Rhodopseudomonas]KIZ36317.1 membrane protein [Rhodopseudomonas palustris]MDF3814107.1 MtrB/PioB family decaheme-associated outer membrane protein [Rhodopseudomonas sp. BAL398]WOK20050.1 MtrB/PioB family decaheme-associated outer membrane protein [Rhodopseudomonas sp. BAL398]